MGQPTPDKQDYTWDDATQGWHLPQTAAQKAENPNGYNPGNGFKGSYDDQQAAAVHAMGAQLAARDKMILGRQAPTLRDNSWEFNQTNDSRNMQLDALEQQRQAALGNGPSLARVQTQQHMGQGMNQIGAQMGGGNLLAQRAAMMGGNAMLGQAASQGASARGNEIYGAMGQYGQGAAGLRSADLWAQQAAMQQVAAQRQLQLNQARHNTSQVEGYEGLDLDAAINQTRLAQAGHQRNVDAGMAQQKETVGAAGAAASTAATMISLAAMLAAL